MDENVNLLTFSKTVYLNEFKKTIVSKDFLSTMIDEKTASETADENSSMDVNVNGKITAHSDVSTASLPSNIVSPTHHFSIPISLDDGLIVDELYASGLFHGAIITDFLPFISNKPGDFFFAILLDKIQAISQEHDSSLYFIVARGKERYYLKQITISPDRKTLIVQGTAGKCCDISTLLMMFKHNQSMYFNEKIMRRPLKRFSWIYHISEINNEENIGYLRTAATCGSLQHVKGKVAFRRMNTTMENARKIFNEVKVLSKINHTNITKFYGISAFQDVALLTEFCEGGSLHSMIHNNDEYSKNLTEFNRIRLLFQLSEALIYLKSQAIVHRKIEPKNILLTVNLDVKLSNFAYAGIHTLKVLTQNNSKSFFYKLLYSRYKNEELAEMEWPMSELPENVLEKLLKESPYISPETAVSHVFSCQSDLWQFAMTLYELYSQKQPFHFAAGPMYKLHNLICTLSNWMHLPDGTDDGIKEIFEHSTRRYGCDRMKIHEIKEKLHNLLINLNESRV